MTSNTGTLSFMLYGILIAMAIAGMFMAIYLIKKSNIPAEKLDKIIDLAKYTILSVAIATVSLIITDLFKEREQDVKELEYFDKYVQDMKKVENIQERLQLSRYLSIVSPDGELKNSWKKLNDTLKREYVEYLAALEQQKKYAALDSLTKEQSDSLVIANDKVQISQSPIIGSAVNNIRPRVYIQVGKEEQREMAKAFQLVLQHENFITPGIENVGTRQHVFIPAKTEVRYYRDEDLADALRLIEILKNQNQLPVKDTPIRIPGDGRGTRPGHFEIWFSK